MPTALLGEPKTPQRTLSLEGSRNTSTGDCRDVHWGKDKHVYQRGARVLQNAGLFSSQREGGEVCGHAAHPSGSTLRLEGIETKDRMQDLQSELVVVLVLQ